MTEKPDVEQAFSEWGWECHERAQRQRYARIDLADKIAWLEEAQRMVLLMKQQRSSVRDRGANDDSKDSNQSSGAW